MKKFLSIMLAMVMVLSMITPVFASTFEDTVDTDHEVAIEFLIGLGLVNGYEDGTYKPEKVVTRAEMAKLLVISLKLESGADILKNVVSFDDVAIDHWANGYIAVAAQYGLIKGDAGTKNFRPDDTVNYAEAITMVVRTLGLGNVVETEGQWPTNYIAEASELELLDNVTEFDAGKGATRGAVAEILWNMLNRLMWYKDSENRQEGNIIYSSSAPYTMLDIKFPKYDFDTLTFEAWDYAPEDGEQTVLLYFDELDDGIEYVENDFYTFVPGTKLDVLSYEDEDEFKVVALVVNADNYLDEGTAKDLADKYDAIEALVDDDDNYLDEGTAKDLVDDDDKEIADYDYIYGLFEGKKASSGLVSDDSYVVIYSDDSYYVEEIEETKDGFTVIECEKKGSTLDFDEDEDYLVIKDGKRVAMDAIEVDDVFTVIRWTDEEVEEPEVLVVANDTKEGEITKYVEDDNVLTLGGSKYFVTNSATYIVDPKDEDSDSEAWVDATYADFKDETAKVYLDMLGNIVRVSFDELTEDASNGAFYVVTKTPWLVSDEDGAQYKIKLMDMNGETKTYTFDESISDEEGIILLFEYAGVKNSVIWAEFDDEKINEIEEIIIFDNPNINPGIDTMDLYDGILNGKDEPEDEDEWLSGYVADDIELENSYLVEGDNKFKVNSDTKLIKLITDLDEENLSDTTYTVEIEEGKDAFKGIEGPAVVYYSGDFKTAKYVFVWDNTTTTDLMYGIVDSVEADSVNEEYTAVLVDEKGNEKEYVTAEELREGTLVAYVLNSDDEVVVKETARPIDFAYAPEVGTVDTDKRRAITNSEDEYYKVIDLDDEVFSDDFEDWAVGIAKVGYSEDKEDLGFDGFYFTGFEISSYEDLKFAKKDFIGLGADEEIIVVYKLTNVAYNTFKEE